MGLAKTNEERARGDEGRSMAEEEVNLKKHKTRQRATISSTKRRRGSIQRGRAPEVSDRVGGDQVPERGEGLSLLNQFAPIPVDRQSQKNTEKGAGREKNQGKTKSTGLRVREQKRGDP